MAADRFTFSSFPVSELDSLTKKDNTISMGKSVGPQEVAIAHHSWWRRWHVHRDYCTLLSIIQNKCQDDQLRMLFDNPVSGPHIPLEVLHEDEL